MTIDQILQDLLKLKATERHELAQRLLESLDEEMDPDTTTEMSSNSRTEIHRLWEEIQLREYQPPTPPDPPIPPTRH